MKTVRVILNGVPVHIEYVTPKHVPGCMGNADSVKGRVRVDSTLALHQKRSTVLHEFIHMIADTTGIELSERDVLSLETGLYSLLRQTAFLRELGLKKQVDR